MATYSGSYMELHGNKATRNVRDVYVLTLVRESHATLTPKPIHAEA